MGDPLGAGNHPGATYCGPQRSFALKQPPGAVEYSPG